MHYCTKNYYEIIICSHLMLYTDPKKKTMIVMVSELDADVKRAQIVAASYGENSAKSNFTLKVMIFSFLQK